MLKLIHSVLFYLLLVISYLLGTTLTLVISWFYRPADRPFLIAAHFWARLLGFFSGVKVAVSGLENIPKNQAVIFAANHQGAADIPIVLACIPTPFKFAIKKELFNVPIFGWYLKKCAYFPVDREAIYNINRMVNTFSDALKKGDSILIFPEGTRSRSGRLGEFKRGSLLCAQKTGAPVVPIAISGSYNLMPRGSWLVKPGKAKLYFCKPVYFTAETDYEKNVEAVRSAIASALQIL